jgi:undecaprenyl diphosphate synthase
MDECDNDKKAGSGLASGLKTEDLPNHVGIIMDGNGRWAKKRGLPRTQGHLEGLKAARRTVEAASGMGLRCLTLYIFSTENWKRAQNEVDFIMGLVKTYLLKELDFYRAQGLRIRHAGDIERLPTDVRSDLETAITKTSENMGMNVVLALNYGGRDEISRAVNRMLRHRGDARSPVSESEIQSYLDNPDIPDPDLIVRTAGEFRTSNFLLWEAAYSEYYISDKFWPDFGPSDLETAILTYAKRERRFGNAV